MKLTLKQGKFLVVLARKTITSYLEGKKPEKPEHDSIFDEERGVFVTLHTHPEGKLRGCIGYPEPTLSLIDAIMDAAISAATHDSRFPKVKPEEMDNLIIEATVLTKPEQIQPDPKKIKIGEDGLIIEKGHSKGILLPQVPIDWDWDAEAFLMQTCYKAGLPPDEWQEPGTKVYKFQGQIFAELRPGGDVKEKHLKP
jgi:uncharacterized protein (TIGR00296 family)